MPGSPFMPVEGLTAASSKARERAPWPARVRVDIQAVRYKCGERTPLYGSHATDCWVTAIRAFPQRTWSTLAARRHPPMPELTRPRPDLLRCTDGHARRRPRSEERR